MIVPLALALQLTKPPDHWFGADKLKHFFVAAFTQTVAYSALQAAKADHGGAMAGAWAVTAAVSVGKELHDRRTTGLFSLRDLVWDAAGAGAAALLLEHSVRRSKDRDTNPPPLAESLLTPLPPGSILHRVATPTFVHVR
jgi:putative lipoprotein